MTLGRTTWFPRSTATPATARAPGVHLPAGYWLVALALLALRLALLLWSVRHPLPPHGDEPIYDAVARNLLAGLGYTYKGAPWIFKPPGWPVMLAAIYATLGSARASVCLVQGLFDSGTALLTAWAAGRIFGSRAATAITFVLVLAWPPLLRESREMQTDPMFTFTVALTLAAFVQFALRPSAARGLLLGLAAGVATLVRPNGLGPAGALVLAWLWPHRRELRAHLPRLAAIALGVALVLAPWTARNWRVFHAFVPVSTGGGEQFYIGAMLETEGRWNTVLYFPLRGAVLEAESRRLGRWPDPVEADHAMLRAGIAYWKREPVRSAVITFKRVARLCLLPVDRSDRPLLRVAFLVTLVGTWLLAVPAGIGGMRAHGPPRELAGAVALAVVLNVAALSFFYTNSRYLEPVRPFVLLLAAGTGADAMLRLRSAGPDGGPR